MVDEWPAGVALLVAGAGLKCYNDHVPVFPAAEPPVSTL